MKGRMKKCLAIVGVVCMLLTTVSASSNTGIMLCGGGFVCPKLED